MCNNTGGHMPTQQQEEYRALRATIGQRGTARVWVFVAGILGWAALAMATAALASLPVATFLPLLFLAVTFEAVFSLHVGVERIGRYLQVFHEDSSGWEHTAMAFGKPMAGTGADPLFVVHFLIADLLNIVPALLAEPVQLEIIVVGTAHLLFAVRVLLAARSAGKQRAADLKRFEELKIGRA